MADLSADSRCFDRRGIIPRGIPAERTSRKNDRCHGHISESDGSIQAIVVLPAYSREYVLDCRSQRHAAESKTLLESRPALHSAGCRKCPLASVGLQRCWPVAHWLVG